MWLPSNNYIFSLNLTPGFNALGGDNHKTRGESFMFWELVRPILESLRYFRQILEQVQQGSVNM